MPTENFLLVYWSRGSAGLELYTIHLFLAFSGGLNFLHAARIRQMSIFGLEIAGMNIPMRRFNSSSLYLILGRARLQLSTVSLNKFVLAGVSFRL